MKLTCPKCRQTFDRNGPAGGVVTCPGCGFSKGASRAEPLASLAGAYAAVPEGDHDGPPPAGGRPVSPTGTCLKLAEGLEAAAIAVGGLSAMACVVPVVAGCRQASWEQGLPLIVGGVVGLLTVGLLSLTAFFAASVGRVLVEIARKT